MRIPSAATPRPSSRRRTIALLIAAAVLVVLLILVQALSGFYANFLWFHWSAVGAVWGTVTLSKVLLALTFFAIAFAVLWGTLFLVDRVVARTLFLAPDTEFVRRYQAVVAPHALAVRNVVAGLLALLFGSSTASQWQNWLLFTHAQPVGTLDPLFRRDLSYFLFRLPFLSFLVDWVMGLLVVAFVLTAAAYFLHGAVRVQRSLEVEPRAIAHFSLVLSLMALERAWAYFYVDRFGLDLSTDGYVSGAGYTDVHVRLPAIELLAVVSLAAFVLLALNVYRRSTIYPLIAVGLWAFLAIALGAIYPKIIQAVHVTPAQSKLEKPYITSNIEATDAAFAISPQQVTTDAFPANQDLTPAVLQRYASTLNATQLWDPVYSLPTFEKLQDELSYYYMTNLTIDRYDLNGQLTPVDVGVRSLNTPGVPSQSWVNTHLQYTHGYAAAVAAANTIAPSSGGSPQFLVGSVPVTSSNAALDITKPDVYFAPGDNQYVVVDSGQKEVEYQNANGQTKEGTYTGSGGIPIGSLFSRLAFALHLHDFNLLISGLIDSHSRLIYIPNVRAEVQKALPFLSVDANPYAVIDHGRLDWVLDAYTTSAYYPYSQTANTSTLASSSGLSGHYNYVRDAVKVVVDAYNGTMRFYAIDPAADPLMRTYERIFPGLFQPLSNLQHSDPVLLQHLRYPQDLLAVQSAMYGRYHITDAGAFYQLSDAWLPSQTSTGPDGSPSQTLATGADGKVLRYSPIYELLQLPGQSSLSFDAIEPMVPYSSNDNLQTLSALLVADSSYANYGKLQALVTPTGSSASASGGSGGTTIDGPGLANADMLADPTVSRNITLLDSQGSAVTLGAVQVLPLADSLLYVRPLYVSSTQTKFPTLQDVVVVYGKQVSLAPTLAAAIAGVFGSAPSNISSGGSTSGSTSVATIPSEVRTEIAGGVQAYSAAQAALAAGDLGTYQSEMTRAGQLLQQANELLADGGATAPTAKAPTSKAKATSTKSSTTGPASSNGTTMTSLAA